MIFRKSYQAYVRDVRRAFYRVGEEIRFVKNSPSNIYASNISLSLLLNMDFFNEELSKFEKRLTATGKPPSFDQNLMNWGKFIVDEMNSVAETLGDSSPRGSNPRKQIHSLQEKILALGSSLEKLYGIKTPFQKELEKLVKKSGLTRYRLGSVAFGEPSHLYKLLKGEKRNPARRTVEALCKALMDCSTAIKKKDANGLMKAAGFPDY